jgi:hypothetical protein
MVVWLSNAVLDVLFGVKGALHIEKEELDSHRQTFLSLKLST